MLAPAVHRHRRSARRRKAVTEDGRKNERHTGRELWGEKKKKNRKEERETGRDATRTKRKRIRGAHD